LDAAVTVRGMWGHFAEKKGYDKEFKKRPTANKGGMTRIIERGERRIEDWRIHQGIQWQTFEVVGVTRKIPLSQPLGDRGARLPLREKRHQMEKRENSAGPVGSPVRICSAENCGNSGVNQSMRGGKGKPILKKQKKKKKKGRRTRETRWGFFKKKPGAGEGRVQSEKTRRYLDKGSLGT